MGGIFRIEMSTEQFSDNGISMPDESLVERSCFLDNGGQLKPLVCRVGFTLLNN